MTYRARVRAPGAGDEVPEYWITYSDLIVSLLMVFALLLFLALSNLQGEAAKAAAVEDALKAGLGVFAGDSSIGGVRIDPETGSMTIDETVLFEYASARLRPEAKAVIQEVSRRVIPAVLTDVSLDTMLQAIVIEGHTDTVGSYMYNLRLSQERAHSVMAALLESTASANVPRLQQLLVASGRSEVDPVRDDAGAIDARRSRRIVVRFRLRTDALLTDLIAKLRGAAEE